MRKISLILIILLATGKMTLSQDTNDIDSLLRSLCSIDNSRNVIKREEAVRIIKHGENALPVLMEYFDDTTLTSTKSECNDFVLTKGELAIILADRIESMPYFLLTGIQNCIFSFCENNPNFIEYYFSFLRRDGLDSFIAKYSNWLSSKERKSWAPYQNSQKKSKGKRLKSSA